MSDQIELSTKPAAGAGALNDGEVKIKSVGHEPEKFANQVEYWLSCIGFAVGFGNVWRFPYMCYSNGGAVFLIPYLMCLFFIAIPMYLIETAYGQLLDIKLHQRFGAMYQPLWAVSVCQVLVCFATCIYYITLMAWSFSFFFDSFKSPLPWMLEGAEEATTIDNLWNADFFNKDTLQVSPDISEQGTIVPWLLFCLFCSYIVVYSATWKGLKSTGKFVYVSCLLPYLILTILLIKGLTLEGCGRGFEYLFKPDWSKLWDPQVWKSAANQILFSSGVSYGPLLYYGTARQKEDKLLTASYLIPAINSATSFYAALTIFSFLGHVSYSKDIPFDQVSKSGPELLFVAFPALIGLLDGANFWAVVFFIMCVCLGVDSVFGFFDFYMAYFADVFPQWRAKVRQEVWCLGFVVFSFFWSFMFIVNGGLYNFDLFDQYSGSIQLLFCVLVELYLIPWHFGLDKLSRLMEERTGEKLPKWTYFFIKFLIPAFIFLLFVLTWIAEFSQNDGREAAGWTAGHAWGGRMIMFIPLLIVALGAWKQCECTSIYDAIKDQYGLEFNADGTITKVGAEQKDAEKGELN